MAAAFPASQPVWWDDSSELLIGGIVSDCCSMRKNSVPTAFRVGKQGGLSKQFCNLPVVIFYFAVIFLGHLVN